MWGNQPEDIPFFIPPETSNYFLSIGGDRWEGTPKKKQQPQQQKYQNPEEVIFHTSNISHGYVYYHEATL